MKRRVASVVVLGACNSVFGLSEPQQLPVVDARYFDAPLDAPFGCPPTGEVPSFSRVLHQLPQSCTSYMFSETAGWATATCGGQVSQGPLDGPLSVIPELGSQQTSRDGPRLVPEGDQLIVSHVPLNASFIDLSVYQADSAHVWTFTSGFGVPFEPSTTIRLGVPSRGPIRRIMVHNSDGILHELELVGGATTEIATYTAADLGIDGVDAAPGLSADGLRLVFAASRASAKVVLYSDRASLADRFRMPVPLLGIPSVDDAVMSEDCSRVYFSGDVASVLWVQQR